jgi:uncharacterized protein (TIGR00369 family)
VYAEDVSTGASKREFESAPAPGSWAEWIVWANRLPNFSEIGLECIEIGPGVALLSLPASPLTANPNGSVNGGLVLAAADQCMGLVALTTLQPGALPATATVHAEFLRPAFSPLTFRATVTQRGARLVFVAVDVQDAEQRLCVRCSGTMASQGASDGRQSARLGLSSPGINER